MNAFIAHENSILKTTHKSSLIYIFGIICTAPKLYNKDGTETICFCVKVTKNKIKSYYEINLNKKHYQQILNKNQQIAVMGSPFITRKGNRIGIDATHINQY